VISRRWCLRESGEDAFDEQDDAAGWKLISYMMNKIFISSTRTIMIIIIIIDNQNDDYLLTR